MLGPNGAGKTTCISVLLGLRNATAGEARLFGLQPTDRRARSRCGVMLQESGVPDTLTVRELVELFGSYYPHPMPPERPIGLAVGYEFRREFAGWTPNPIAAQGLDTDYNSRPTNGAYRVNEGFGELDIPLVSNVTGVDELEVTAATRVFNYSSFGTDATYKFGARYRVSTHREISVGQRLIPADNQDFAVRQQRRGVLKAGEIQCAG